MQRCRDRPLFQPQNDRRKAGKIMLKRRRKELRRRRRRKRLWVSLSQRSDDYRFKHRARENDENIEGGGPLSSRDSSGNGWIEPVYHTRA